MSIERSRLAKPIRADEVITRHNDHQ